MEWLENAVGRISETEILDFQDTNTKESVEKILTRKDRKQLRKKWARVSPKKWHSKKIRKDRSTNCHHQIARTSWWSEHAHNKKQMDIKKHNADHGYFWVKLIHDKLIQVLEDNKSVLHRETADLFIWELQQMIKWYIEEHIFYNEKCFKPWRLPKNYKID